MKEIKKTSAYVVIDHSKAKEDLEVDKCADKDRFEIKEAPTQCLIYDCYTDTDVSIYIVERAIL